MKGFNYAIIALLIKSKGIKSTFSKTPIDYLKLRKDDVYKPKPSHVLGLEFETLTIDKNLVTKIVPKKVISTNVILYFHGGASIYGPTDLNWSFIAKIVKESNTIAYLVNYPKAPEHQIIEINHNIGNIYDYILTLTQSENIILMGDSFGGTLATLLIQRLFKKNLPVPKFAILISPVLDCSFTNPEID